MIAPREKFLIIWVWPFWHNVGQKNETERKNINRKQITAGKFYTGANIENIEL
jgi:hypothetical protein